MNRSFGVRPIWQGQPSRLHDRFRYTADPWQHIGWRIERSEKIEIRTRTHTDIPQRIAADRQSMQLVTSVSV